MANDNIWIAGVVLVIIGSLGQNVGQNIISHAHKIIEEVDDRSAKLHASLEERGSARVNSSGEKYKTSGSGRVVLEIRKSKSKEIQKKSWIVVAFYEPVPTTTRTVAIAAAAKEASSRLRWQTAQQAVHPPTCLH